MNPGTAINHLTNLNNSLYSAMISAEHRGYDKAREEYLDIIKKLIPLAQDGIALHRKNGVHWESLRDKSHLIDYAKGLVTEKPSK